MLQHRWGTRALAMHVFQRAACDPIHSSDRCNRRGDGRRGIYTRLRPVWVEIADLCNECHVEFLLELQLYDLR